jgi:hypothetical protein
MPVDSDLALLFGLPGIAGSESVNSAPIILLITNTEENPNQAALDKTVAVVLGTESVAPIDNAAVIDVDGSDIAAIQIVITGMQTAWETLTFLEDIVVEVGGDDNDSTASAPVFGVVFTATYVAATGTVLITQEGGDPFPLAAANAFLTTMAWGKSVTTAAGDRTFTFTATDEAGATSAESTLTINVYAPIVIDANGADGGYDRAVTFTEGGSAVSLLDAAGTVSGDVNYVVGSIAGVVSPAYEILQVDGIDYPLGTSVIDDDVLEGSTTFTIQVIAGDPVSLLIKATDDSTVAQADIQSLMRSATFRSTLEGPAEGDRVFTWYPVDGNGNAGTPSTTTVTVEQTAPTSIAHTTAQAGPWEDPATWTAGVVPGAADTITMTHHVTAYANQLFGHSPDEGDGTKALFIGSGGQLTIADGVTVRVRGDVQIGANGAKINIGANSLLLFDNSLCSDPTTEEYQLIIGASGVTTAELISTGTQGNPARIETYNPSGTYKNAVLNYIGTRGGKQRNNYFHFKHLGGTTRYGIYMAGLAEGDKTIEFNNGVMEDTGGIYWEYALAGDSIFRMQDVTFVDSKVSGGKPEILRTFTYGAMTTGERTISGSVFDKKPRLTWADGTVDDVIMLEGWSAGGFNIAWDSFKDSIVHWTDNAEPNVYTSPVNCYFAITPAGANNNAVHISIQLADTPPGKSLPGVYDCFFENTTGDSYQGGMIRILGPLSGAKTFRIEGNITVYHPDGQSGKLLGLHGDANTTVEVYNNSCLVGHVDNADGHEQGFCYGESYAGHVGMIEGGGNLVLRPAAITQPGYMLQQENSTTTPSDVAEWDNNGVWNLSAGSDGMPDGYNRRAMTAPMFDSNVPGANDIDADPGLVDYQRNLATWDASLGGPGTALHALAELAKKGLTGYNAAYNRTDYFAYLRAGWVPTNVLYNTSGPGGGYIGAIPYAAPAGGTPSIDDNTDLEQFTEWQSKMLTKGAEYGGYISAHKNDSAPGQSEFENALILTVYYDAERAYRQIAAYTGDNAWLTIANDARHIYNRWMVANGYVLPGYWKFTQGARMGWEANNSDSQAVDIVNGLANYGAWSPDTVPLSSMESEALSREVAYTMNCYMDQELVGGAHRDKLEDLLDLVLDTDGHIEQWFVNGPVANFAPFMFALTCEALIRYFHEQAEDARIIPAIALGANWIWDNAWSDVYSKFPERLNAPYWEYGSELSLLICPLYHWLYKQTGNVVYKTRGDIIFNTGMENAFFGLYKQFNQIYRWTGDGLLWRAQGDATWGA